MRTISKSGSSVQIRQIPPRQLVVLNLVARGLTNKEIGADLSIEEGTVRAHISALLQAFGASNRTELTAISYKTEGLLSHGRVATGHHPRGCTCGFSYCPDRQAASAIRIDTAERLGAMAPA